jgi:hypothetical protein
MRPGTASSVGAHGPGAAALGCKASELGVPLITLAGDDERASRRPAARFRSLWESERQFGRCTPRTRAASVSSAGSLRPCHAIVPVFPTTLTCAEPCTVSGRSAHDVTTRPHASTVTAPPPISTELHPERPIVQRRPPQTARDISLDLANVRRRPNWGFPLTPSGCDMGYRANRSPTAASRRADDYEPLPRLSDPPNSRTTHRARRPGRGRGTGFETTIFERYPTALVDAPPVGYDAIC